MSDAELRELEHALAQAPDDLGLLRQHAAVLRRYGQPERALASLDLAWRLGAEELEAELSAELERRSFSLLGLRFRYVPAGPFVMGLDRFDDDTQPAHLVRLSAFYVSETPVLRRTIKDSELVGQWIRDHLAGDPESSLGRYEVTGDRAKVGKAVAYLADAAEESDDVPGGQLGLPTEAQWERAFRANLLRPNGTSIYGVRPAREQVPEWVADTYASNAYARSSVFDPVGPATGKQFVIRGVELRSAELFPIYRDSANASGAFKVGIAGGRSVRHEHGIAFRVVLQPQ